MGFSHSILMSICILLASPLLVLSAFANEPQSAGRQRFPLPSHEDISISAESLPDALLIPQLNSSMLQRRSESEIRSAIDDFVNDWIHRHGDSNIPSIIATSDQVKLALFNPASEASASSQARSDDTSARRHLQHSRQLANASLSFNTTLSAARALVKQAQIEQNARNAERFKNPRTNQYYTKENTLRKRADDTLSVVNDTIAAAAAQVAEADAAEIGGYKVAEYSVPPKYSGIVSSVSSSLSDLEKRDGLEKRDSSFWMEGVPHVGTAPFGGDDNTDYVYGDPQLRSSRPKPQSEPRPQTNFASVFRNVKDYGAVGNGSKDDTAAINKALADGNRCGASCGSSSVKPVIIYFPAGTYVISSSLSMPYMTQIIGNANSKPVLKAAKSFVGSGLLSSDVYTGIPNPDGSDGEWFINQSNFYRQVRNVIIDITSADLDDMWGIHWQVAQATSIQEVDFLQSTDPNKHHVGVFAENGSGGFMSDMLFIGGAVGMKCGNQQFTTRNLIFLDCITAIEMLWDWGWTWKSLLIAGSTYGILVDGTYAGGSINVLDSYMQDTTYGIYISTPEGGTITEQFSINIDNLVIGNVGTAVTDLASSVTLAGGSTTIASWTLGRVYDSNNPDGVFQTGGPLSTIHPAPTTLGGGPNGGFFERSKTQYNQLGSDQFINAKISAKGDGSTDDTFAINLLLSLVEPLGKILYFPHGSYIVTDTIHVPVGSRIVGECWSEIVASGANFEDRTNPRVMMQIGAEGDIGVIEIQDLLFTTVGHTAGAILMEWNVAQSSPGSVAMWDSHFRVGGAKGTNLQAADCPKLTGDVNPKCIAASMMLHMTPSSSGYLENVWAWVADHDLDSALDQTMIDIYVARGVLIESVGPTWLYGTASEHSILYQYQVFGAKDLFMGMIQTESPYFFPAPQAPFPFNDTVGQFNGDPRFDDCDSSTTHCAAAWALRVINSENVHIAGAGLYNWFQGYNQDCVDTQDCQQRGTQISSSSSVYVYNLYTIGTVEMLSFGTDSILAKDNTDRQLHPYTSVINALLSTASSDDDDEYDGHIWNDDPVPVPDCTATYNTIDQVVSSAANIPANCLDQYLVAVELNILDTALDAYVTTINDGYDDKFKIYSDHIAALVPLQLNAYMAGAQASGFWTCTTTGYVTCCKSCLSAGGCPSTCDNSASCVSGVRTTVVNCPTIIPDSTDIGINDEGIEPLVYTCTDTDGFYKDIADKYGVAQAWIVFGPFEAASNGGCGRAGGNCDPNAAVSCCTFWRGFPLAAATIAVDNPKDLISGSFDMTKDLAAELHQRELFMPWTYTFADYSTLVDAASLPALLTSTAVDSMGKVVAAADKITADERKEFILNFVLAIVLLIPGVGEAVDGTLFAGLKTVIDLLGTTGNVALGIYGVVQDPKSAIFLLFGALLGGKGEFGSEDFVDAANERRGFAESDLDIVAPIKPDLQKIADVRTSCFR